MRIGNLKFDWVSIANKDLVEIWAHRKSFNEDVTIDFDCVNHAYWNNGVRLTGVTSYIKKFFPEFNAEAVSKASAKAWDVDQQDVKDLWASNAKLTSDFGTLVH